MKTLTKMIALSVSASAVLLAGGGTAPVEADVAPVNDVNWQIALKAGTLGLGVDVVRPINDRFAVRFNVNGLSVHDYEVDYTEYTDVDISGATLLANVDLFTAGALLDWHPFRNGFLVSAGAYYNGNGASLVADVKDKVTYEGTEYTNDVINSITSEVTFDNQFAPYFGIGYSNITESGWGFSWDIGAMYHGTPKVATTINYGSGATDADKADIEKSRIDADKTANDSIADYAIANFYPVIRVGIRYNF